MYQTMPKYAVYTHKLIYVCHKSSKFKSQLISQFSFPRFRSWYALVGRPLLLVENTGHYRQPEGNGIQVEGIANQGKTRKLYYVSKAT